MAGSYKGTFTRLWRQTSDMSAYLSVVRTTDVRVSTGLSPLTCVSSVIEPKRPDLRTLFRTQIDIIIEETWIEVKWVWLPFIGDMVDIWDTVDIWYEPFNIFYFQNQNPEILSQQQIDKTSLKFWNHRKSSFLHTLLTNVTYFPFSTSWFLSWAPSGNV